MRTSIGAIILPTAEWSGKVFDGLTLSRHLSHVREPWEDMVEVSPKKEQMQTPFGRMNLNTGQCGWYREDKGPGKAGSEVLEES